MSLLLRRNEGAGREQEEGSGLADIIHMETQGQECEEPNGNQHIKANTELKTNKTENSSIHALVQNIKFYIPQIPKKFLKKLSDGEWEPGQRGIKDCFSIVNLIILWIFNLHVVLF